ncbi:MAG: LytTR family transcriptional regulator DNA-binding domain-containing protein [Oscillospiraceae bacterium]
MSKPNIYTPEEVINKTRQVVHSFYTRNIQPMADMLDDNFVWIGAYEFQYIRGKKEFLNSIKAESKEMPVHVSEEEFHILAHDRYLWTVYGRYTATAIQEDNTMLLAKTRNTFVWKQVDDKLMLLHIHGSHARDVPLEFSGNLPPSITDSTAWFESLKKVDRLVGPPKKLTFRDGDGTYHFVLPSEILYIKAEAKQCTVHTGNDCFVARVLLKDFADKSPLFLQCHRSYIVNIHSIKAIKRYELKLSDGTVLPIGKERYMDVKEHLHAIG